MKFKTLVGKFDSDRCAFWDNVLQEIQRNENINLQYVKGDEIIGFLIFDL